MTRKNFFHALQRLKPALVVGVILSWGCDFKVVNPGAIVEDALNDPAGVRSLLTGMSSDFSEEYDGVAFLIARAGDEAAGSGSYNTTALFKTGQVIREDVNGVWDGINRARWVAEDGLRRMRDDIADFDFATDPAVARAYLFAAFANRVQGESFCEGVIAASDDLGAGGGPAVPKSEAFNRAIRWFNEVIGHPGASADQITAARGGIAQAYVGLGDWVNAPIHAAMVTDIAFVFEAIYDQNSGRERNVLFIEGQRRGEYSMFGSLAGGRIFGETVADYTTRVDAGDPPQDPRALYTRCDVNVGSVCNSGAFAADGVTLRWQQEKYPEFGTEIPVIKGVEMRLIQAEAELMNSGVAGIPAAIGFMNEVRTELEVTPALVAPATVEAAMMMLDDERHLTLWLEGRRFNDLYRWDQAGFDFLRGVKFVRGDNDFSVVNDKDASIAKRATCIPISFDECLSNDNLNCQ